MTVSRVMFGGLGVSDPLRKVALVGAGFLGTQIAMLAANAGYEVTVYDQREGAFKQTYNKIVSDLKKRDVTPFIPWEKWESCVRRVQLVKDLGIAVQDADLVIEAVPEDVQLKNEVFRQIGRKAPPRAILVTNSSSIPVSKMEVSSDRPERCLNIHFYFPLEGINMVDIMGGTKTLPEVMDKAARWISSLGRIPLPVKKEILGFCFNRVWRAVKREALYIWANGFVDFRDVDRAWMVFTRMREGPFGLMDKVGLDVVYGIETVYYHDSNDPKDKPPDALLAMIKRGELGVKSGKGFYTYPDPEFAQPAFLKTDRSVAHYQ
jgi:3-hydroxybutyryl-CoA dehydrogenase